MKKICEFCGSEVKVQSIHSLDGDKEITTQINLQEGLKAPTAANSSTNSEREFPTASNLQESIEQ
jgi:hypothetical protein